MITQVEVRNTSGDLLTFVLDDTTDGFVFEDLEGTDPVKATLAYSKVQGRSGGVFQNVQRENRNLKLILTLEPDYIDTSVYDLRVQLYNFFMPESQVYLRIFLDNDLVVDIDGYVESCDAPSFVQDPKATISIVCFDPDFVAIDSVVIEGDTVDDTEDTTILYEGNVSTGLKIVLNVDRVLSDFTVYVKAGDNVVRTFPIQGSFIADDVITINSTPDEKAVTLLRDNVTTSILYAKSPQGEWPVFTRGVYHFRIYTDGAPIPYTVEYVPRYGGL